MAGRFVRAERLNRLEGDDVEAFPSDRSGSNHAPDTVNDASLESSGLRQLLPPARQSPILQGCCSIPRDQCQRRLSPTDIFSSCAPALVSCVASGVCTAAHDEQMHSCYASDVESIVVLTILVLFGWRLFFEANDGIELIHVHCRKGDVE